MKGHIFLLNPTSSYAGKLYILHMGHSVLISTYCITPAASSNICHPLNVQWSIRPEGSCRTAKPLLRPKVQTVRERSHHSILIASHILMNTTDIDQAGTSESLFAQGESSPDFSMAGLRLEFLADNIAIQGEFAAAFHNSRAQACGHALTTWLDSSHAVVRREWEEFKHSQLCLDYQNNSSLLSAPRCIYLIICPGQKAGQDLMWRQRNTWFCPSLHSGWGGGRGEDVQKEEAERGNQGGSGWLREKTRGGGFSEYSCWSLAWKYSVSVSQPLATDRLKGGEDALKGGNEPPRFRGSFLPSRCEGRGREASSVSTNIQRLKKIHIASFLEVSCLLL